jgi:hypothetical protein
MRAITRRDLLISFAVVAGSCRAEPQSEVVTLAIRGML